MVRLTVALQGIRTSPHRRYRLPAPGTVGRHAESTRGNVQCGDLLVTVAPDDQINYTARVVDDHHPAVSSRPPYDVVAPVGFRVTIVVRLLDENGRQITAANQSFRIDARTSAPLRGEGLVEGAQTAQVASWRIEYWVETDRRVGR